MKSNLPPVNKEDLVPGATFTGVVRSVQPFGLFVDFGASTDGLVHISQISSSYVKDVKALFTVGQEVEVRLLEYDMQAGRISLTMRAPGDEKKEGSRGGADTAMGKGGRTRQDRRRPRYLEGDICSGTVKEISEEGAIVTLPGGGEGILPVSEQVVVDGSEGGATLEVDQEIEVRVLSVIEGDITLTMKEEEYVDKELLKLLEKKKEGQDTFTVEIDREFEVLEKMGVEYEEEGEEGGDDAEEVVDQAALENPSFDVDDGTILVNPFVSTFLRSRYAANAEKRLELIGAVKKAGSVVAVSTASVCGVAGGEVAVAGDGSEVGSVSIAEEPVAVTEVEGGEVAAVGAASEAGYDPAVDKPVAAAEAVSEVTAAEAVSDSAVNDTSSVATESTAEASAAEPLVAASETGYDPAEDKPVAAAEAVSDSTVTETSSVATESTTEASAAEPLVAASETGYDPAVDKPVATADAVSEIAAAEAVSDSTVTETSSVATESTTKASAAEPLVAGTSEVKEGEVAAAEAVPEVSKSEVSSEIGSVSVAEEPVAISEAEKSEVAAAEAVPEVTQSEVASESTVTEASTGTTDSTTEVPLADEPAAVTSKVEVGEVTAVGTVSDSIISENSVSDSQAVLSESGASEITASGITQEDASDKTAEAVSINVGDEKTDVSEATPEASPNHAREVKGKDAFQSLLA